MPTLCQIEVAAPTGDDAMGRLTTHVLDTMHGRPAVGMRVQLHCVADDGRMTLLSSHTLNADGRCEAALLEGADLHPGRYRLVFGVEAYFRALGVDLPTPAFLAEVPLDFGIADALAHYHVPLLTSPWSYSSYRGS